MPRPGVSPSAGDPVNQASVSVSISVSVAGPIRRTRDRGPGRWFMRGVKHDPSDTWGASGAERCRFHVRLWHLADMKTALENVCFRAQSRH
jgi:hypothetical protein